MRHGGTRQRENIENAILAARNERQMPRFIQDDGVWPRADRDQARQRAGRDIDDRRFAIGARRDEAVVGLVISEAGRRVAAEQRNR